MLWQQSLPYFLRFYLLSDHFFLQFYLVFKVIKRLIAWKLDSLHEIIRIFSFVFHFEYESLNFDLLSVLSFMIHKDDISVVSYFGPDNISLDLLSESHDTVGCIPIRYSLGVLGK